MNSENIDENEGEKNSPNTPSVAIPDSITVPTELDDTPQCINDTSTIVTLNNTPKDNEYVSPSNDKNIASKFFFINSMTPFTNASLADFAQSIKEDDYLFEDATITRELGELTGITQRYIKEKGKIVKRFFEILSKNKVLGFLAEVITDPQDKHLQTTLFYSKLRGVKNPAKYTILNGAMCWFAINFKKMDKKFEKIRLTDKIWTKEHALACYESTTTSQRIKELFVEFHEQGIIYGTNDFDKQGGFNNFFVQLFEKVKKYRPKFGRLSFSSNFDHNAEMKIRKYGDYKPFEVYEDCLELLIHYTLKYFQLRGRQEVSFSKKKKILNVNSITNINVLLFYSLHRLIVPIGNYSKKKVGNTKEENVYV